MVNEGLIERGQQVVGAVAATAMAMTVSVVTGEEPEKELVKVRLGS